MAHQIPNYVLIASTGKQDIKFWLHGTDKKHGKKRIAAEIQDSKSMKCESFDNTLTIRDIHSKFLNGEILYEFNKKPLIEEIQNDRISFDADILFNRNLTPTLQVSNNYKADIQVVIIKNKYQLYAAKLQGLISTLKELQNKNKIKVIGGLFLGTDRNGNQGEPISSHILLAKYFAKEFSLDNAKEFDSLNLNNTNVFWLNQMKDIANLSKYNQRYEGEGIDYPVKRVIAKRIDDTVHKFIEHFSVNKANVILSHTGGMADLKSLLSASVRFRENKRVLESHQTEKIDTFDTSAFKRLIKDQLLVSRQQSLQIKTLVKNRILEGDIAGAWSACAHIHDETQPVKHDIWTYAVQAVKNYFAGDNSFNLDVAASVNNKIPDTIKDQFQKLNQHLKTLTTDDGDDFEKQSQSALTRTLFHIESALQARKMQERDIINAAIHSTSLNDQLLRTCIYHYLNTHRNEFAHLKDFLQFDNDSVLKQSWNDNSDKRFKTTRNGTTTTKLSGYNGRFAWMRTLRSDRILNIPNIYSKRLTYPNRSPNNPEDKSLSQWRNTIAHGLGMESSDLEQILIIATLASGEMQPIWNPDLQGKTNLSTGTCILNQHYTQQIEESLGYGIGSTRKKYITLQKLLLDIINSPIYLAD